MTSALIIGSGPNGLSAAIRLAQAGVSVLVLEGSETFGGGARSAELTLPGFVHDVCSAIHPLSLLSPFLSTLPLSGYGLEWVHPDVPVAHALAQDHPVLLHKDLDEAAAGLGRDGEAYRRLFRPLVDGYRGLMEDFLGPFPLPPKHPIIMGRFGLLAVQSASGIARRRFREQPARAAFAGLAAHAMMPLEWPALGGFGLMLGISAHAVGWPMARGGSGQIAAAMAAHLRELGGEIRTGRFITSRDQLPSADIVLFDTAPRALLQILGDDLAPGYARQLRRYRYGPGVCKVDWALSEPIPWLEPDFSLAATVHLSGPLDDIERSERTVWQGQVSERPFILLVQQSHFDDRRAPPGKHTAWAYCHVPANSGEDFSGRIESEIERHAPGFRETILARSVRSARDMEAYNPNYVGGDINTGVQDLRQLFTRPGLRWNPYRVPGSFGGRRAYLCSSATPPGGGVHGMCGFHAAETALKDLGRH